MIMWSHQLLWPVLLCFPVRVPALKVLLMNLCEAYGLYLRLAVA